MSLIHLETGSPFPPLKPGTLRIYSMKYCPHAQQTRLVLAHKGIPFEVVNINLRNKPEWFLLKNPLGKVPCIEIDGKIIYDSAICNRYLDKAYPQNKLIPDEPYERALMYMWMERFQSKVVPPFSHLTFDAQKKDPEKISEVQAQLQPFEEILSDGRPFYGGEILDLLDIRVWPVLEKVDHLHKYGISIIPKDMFPNLYDWKERMSKTPAVINGGGTDMVNFYKFDFKNHNYDVGVTTK